MKPLPAAALLFFFSSSLQALPNDPFDGGRGGAPGLGAPPASADGVSAENRAPDPERFWVTVLAGDAAARSAVSAAGVSIERVLQGKVLGSASRGDLERLKETKLSFTSRPLGGKFGALEFPAGDEIFHNYDRTEAELKALAAESAGHASVFSIGQSLLGKELWAIRISSVAGDAPSANPGIIFLGTHHAREHLSTEVPLLLAKYLIQNRTRRDLAPLLASRDIFIVPMVNPDGVEWDIRGGRYHMHRKNRRDNADGSVGVDLNRNYDYHWAEGGASGDPGSETYHGPSAFSEPETQAVRDFITRHKDNVKIVLSYHTFSELILYPWGYTKRPLSETGPLAAYRAMATTMAGMTGYTPEQSSALYIASGDTTDWAWGRLGIYSFTFELTPKSMDEGGFYPGALAVNSTFQNNIRPALYLIGLADDPLRAASPNSRSSGR